MVSVNFFAIVAVLFATTVLSNPGTLPTSKDAIIGEKTKYCEKFSIDNESEQYVTVDSQFKKIKPKKNTKVDDAINIISSDEVLQFNSTVKYDLVSENFYKR